MFDVWYDFNHGSDVWKGVIVHGSDLIALRLIRLLWLLIGICIRFTSMDFSVFIIVLYSIYIYIVLYIV